MDERIFIYLLLYIFKCDFSMISEKFVANKYCPNYILYSFERYYEVNARNNLDCAQHCSKDLNCISYNYLPDSLQCHFNKGIINVNCSNGEFVPNSLYYENLDRIPVCLNGGQWSSSTSKCVCVGGYVGIKCERLMEDCEEGETYYADQKAFFYIFPPAAPEPFEILCTMKWGTRNILMQHYDLSFTYNKSWQQYNDGFIDDKKDNFWLGLDKIYYLIRSKTREIHIEIRENNNYFTNSYDNFRIGNESTGYKLLGLGNPITSELDPCLPSLIGSPFSTFDNDQDGDSRINCAAVYGVGWWFTQQNCAVCNPMGEMNNPTGGTWNGDKSFAFWQGKSWSPDGVKIYLQD